MRFCPTRISDHPKRPISAHGKPEFQENHQKPLRLKPEKRRKWGEDGTLKVSILVSVNVQKVLNESEGFDVLRKRWPTIQRALKPRKCVKTSKNRSKNVKNGINPKTSNMASEMPHYVQKMGPD
jgi:hypothetical protein